MDLDEYLALSGTDRRSLLSLAHDQASAADDWIA